MENKIQLRGRELLFPGGRESKRGEESSKSSWGTGQAVRQPASGNGRTPRGHSPSPAPSARPQPRPNTASGCLVLTQRRRRLQASQNRGVPRKEGSRPRFLTQQEESCGHHKPRPLPHASFQRRVPAPAQPHASTRTPRPAAPPERGNPTLPCCPRPEAGRNDAEGCSSPALSR